MESRWVSAGVFQSQRSSLTLQPQQNLPASLYNTMMIPQQSAANVVQIATSLAQNPGPNTPAVATFAQDHAAQIRLAASFSWFSSYLILFNFCWRGVVILIVPPC